MHVAAVTGTETEARGFLRAVARLAPHRFNLMELEVLVGTQGNAAQPLESGERRRVIVVHQDDEYLKVFESMDDALNCLEVWTRSGVEGVKVVEVVTNTWLIEAPGEYAAT